MNFTVRPIAGSDRDWVLGIIRGWGADFVVPRGRKVYAADLPGFIAENDGLAKVGFLIYEILGDQCHVVTMHAFEQFSGIGTALLNEVVKTARAAGCKRLWLVTTNDNLDAMRFYQRRGLTIAAVYVNAIAHARELKPSFPKVGYYGIPIRDEIEFEMRLQVSGVTGPDAGSVTVSRASSKLTPCRPVAIISLSKNRNP